MGIFENCILASDIDNTLVADGYINPRNVEKRKFIQLLSKDFLH